MIRHNPRSSSATVARINRRGFSLIEAAIVLAVVGGVIGGIWVASAKFYEDYKVNKTIEEIFTTSRNIQNLISISDAEAIGDNVTITDAMKNAGVFPENWMSGDNVVSPFGGHVGVRNLTTSGATRFRIELQDLKISSCILLITRISAIGQDANKSAYVGNKGSYGLGYIAVQNLARTISYLDTTTFPVTVSQAKTVCEIPDIYVYFGFGYTRINN